MKIAAFLLAWILLPGICIAGESSIPLEDFEQGYSPSRWTCWEGREFPGAKGAFTRSADAAHGGQYGGALAFDFSGGGNYVAAIVNVPKDNPPWANALQLWIKRPAGNTVVFRYMDQSGQTLQKNVDCSGGRWTQLTISFDHWEGHWDGANDGKVHGPPRQLGLLIENGQQKTGSLLLDDLKLIDGSAATVHVPYTLYHFDPGEGWHLAWNKNAGITRLDGRMWTADFTQGADSLEINVPDRCLPGDVDRIHLRVRGNAKGHPVRLVLRTHFMTFQKQIGEFTGDGEQELITDGPPGPGWQWYGGEDDGIIHGPLRVGAIALQANGKSDHCTLELLSVTIDASCPVGRRCILTARCAQTIGESNFIAQLRDMVDKPTIGQLTWTIRSWDGVEVTRGARAVVIPPGAEAVAIPVPVPSLETAAPPARFLEAEFNLNVAGEDVAPAQACWLAPHQPHGDTTLTRESPMGMGIYLNRFGGDPKSLAIMEQTAQLARDAGVKWTREDFSWSRIEPERGRFDWTFYDNVVACAKRNGISVYGIAGYWSSWTKPYTEEGIADYLHYLRALVIHYKGDIHQWEIWNEPNIFFWEGPKEMYAELLTRSYSAIKEIDPTAQILGLSTAGIDNTFIKKMLAAHAPFDVLTIHPYRSSLNDQEFINDLERVSDLVKMPDGRRRPVWLTEMGWATFTPHNTLKQDFRPTTLRAQAELIARSYLCAIVSGIEPRTFWYDFRNDGDDPLYFESQMGIVAHDFSPKPAYIAYSTLARLLTDRRVDKKLDVAPGVFAWRLSHVHPNIAPMIAIWCPTNDTTVQIPSLHPTVIRINTIGEEQTLGSAAGQVTVELKKGAPVYLLFQQQ